MRPRLYALIGLLSGCGATFHATQRVPIEVLGEPARVYQHGYVVPLDAQGRSVVPVFLNDGSGLVAAGPGTRVAPVPLPARLDPVAIGLDALWCFTIVGIAAPISDGILGTLFKVPSSASVTVERDPGGANPMPVYEVAGRVVTP